MITMKRLASAVSFNNVAVDFVDRDTDQEEKINF